MGQDALVGQKQQALGVLVQPAHGEQLPLLELPWQQVQHRFPPAVLCGGEDSGGLVQHDPGVAAVANRLAIHGNLRLLRVKFLLHRPGGGAVHRHQPPADQLLRLPAGPPPGRGDDLVQTLQFHGGPPPFRPRFPESGDCLFDCSIFFWKNE